jgi:TolA-binding protein
MLRKCLFLLIFLFSASVFAQYDVEKVFAFLEDTYNKHDKDLSDVLITDLEQYLDMFPKNPHAPRVQQMLGSVWSEKRKDDEAIASYIKMLCLYPEMSNVAGSSDELRQLIAKNKSYAEKNDWLFGVLDKITSNRSLADAYYQYLGILTDLNQNGLRDWTLDACRNYIEHFPDDSRDEQVLRWMGEVYLSKKDYREAELMYTKYSFLYPNHPQLPGILVKQGEINYEHLRQKEKAQLILQKMITDYPNSDAIPDALFLRGQIFTDLTNFKEAIADYRRLVDNYPEHPKVIESLERIAEIDEKEFKDYRATINVMNEIVEKTKDESKGVDALEHIAKLYERELNDYASAAATYARIADKYPNYEKAPDRLIDAGEICEDKLDDYQKAISYYQMVLDKFPADKKAEDARKKVEKAQEKLNEN